MPANQFAISAQDIRRKVQIGKKIMQRTFRLPAIPFVSNVHIVSDGCATDTYQFPISGNATKV